MRDLLLKLFGIKASGTSRIAEHSLGFHGVNPLLIILLALLVAAVVFFGYILMNRQTPLWRRLVLASFRALFLVLILAILTGPVWSITFEHAVRRSVLLVFDTSSSMSEIKDQRSDEADQKRLAIARNAIDPAKGLNQPLPSGAAATQVPRIEVVQSAFTNDKLNLVPRLAKDFDVSAYTFDKSVVPIAAAEYRSQEAPTAPSVAEHDEPVSLHARYPWLIALVLLVASLAVLGAGLLVKNRYAIWPSLVIAAISFIWLFVAYLTQDKSQDQSAQARVSSTVSTGWVKDLKAQGPLTAVGDSVRDVISQKRGQLLAGIVLVTDGASNSGVQPLDAAQLAGQDRVPLYVYGVGITSPKDITVASILAPEIAFAKDELPVNVRVRATGLAGQSANLTVTLGEQRAEQTVNFNADGEQVVTVNLTPQIKGEFKLTAAIAPRDDEVVKDNNSASQAIRVVDEKIKVLYVEQYPRWEFKYVQAALARDRRIDAKFVLLEADPSVSQGKNTPYLPEIPLRKEDLFKYDLVLLGDVDPKALATSQMDALGEFVSKFGGAMIVLAGKRYAPNAYRKTVIEKMLPVELESVDIGNATTANRPVKLELTPAGKTSPMLRLAERELDSVSRWQSLPPIYWAQKVARAKPAAEVLVVDPDPSKGTRFGKMPVIALQQYGMGQVLYVGTDNLWRIRRNSGDKYHAALWGQMIQRLALPHLLGASKRTQLTADAKTYSVGQRVTIYGRLYSETFEPMTEPTIKAALTEKGSSAPPRPVILRPLPNQPGMYRGELIAPAPGQYSLAVDHDKDPKTALEFGVEDPKLELAETAMNQPLLQQMAQASGGGFFREENLNSLPDQIAGKQERIRTKHEVELWSTPLYFLAMLSLVTAEWIVRKVSQLK